MRAWVGVVVGVGERRSGRVLAKRTRHRQICMCKHVRTRMHTLASLEVAAVDFWAWEALASVAWGGWVGVEVGVCLKGVGWVGVGGGVDGDRAHTHD